MVSIISQHCRSYGSNTTLSYLTYCNINNRVLQYGDPRLFTFRMQYWDTVHCWNIRVESGTRVLEYSSTRVLEYSSTMVPRYSSTRVHSCTRVLKRVQINTMSSIHTIHTNRGFYWILIYFADPQMWANPIGLISFTQCHITWHVKMCRYCKNDLLCFTSQMSHLRGDVRCWSAKDVST